MLLKTFLRSFKKSTLFSTLNVLVLSLGMAVFLLIAQYVHFETSYEDFNSNASNIYRVTLTSYQDGERLVGSAENYPALGAALMELPEVNSFARLNNLGYKNNIVVTNEEAFPNPIAAKTHHLLYADSSFLPMMCYTPSQGVILRTALAVPNTAVITEEYARRYFGEGDAIGKTLHMQDDDHNNELVKITGVVKKVPANTHLKFDILFSYKTLFTRQNNPPADLIARFENSWQRNDKYT
jgi:putative ABC transport system permease protein